MESDIRTVIRAIDPSACAEGKATFDSCQRWLLARVPAVAGYADFIKLLRLMRNTIHNNGIHFPYDGQDASITWAGQIYEFKVGKPIEFTGWSFVVLVGQHILELLRTLTTDPVVIAISAEHA
jgi:hypothetical protein